jgi:hypothetical protein
LEVIWREEVMKGLGGVREEVLEVRDFIIPEGKEVREAVRASREEDCT